MPNPKRDEFIIAMYQKMWDNISRSITLSWQPFAVVVALTGVLAVAVKGTIPIWFASSVGFVIVAWFFGHIYDANGWFWRNHLIAANIEHYFAEPDDKERLNPFMGDLVAPTKAAALFSTMRPHYFLAVALSILLLIFTFLFETGPGLFNNTWPTAWGKSFWGLTVLPYAVAAGCAYWVRQFKKGRDAQYKSTYELAMRGRQ